MPARWLRILLVVVLAAALVTAVGDRRVDAAEPAGELDVTFDDDGIATTDITSNVFVVDQAVQDVPGQGERILVLTRGVSGLRTDVWRFLPDGTLDTSFDDDGVLPLNDHFPTLDHDHLATHPGGRFVTAGEVDPDPPPEPDLGTVGVARFLPDGSPDTSFGTDGLVTVAGSVSPGLGCEQFLDDVTDVVIQPAPGGDFVVVSIAATIQFEGAEFCSSPVSGGILARLDDDGAVASLTPTTRGGGWEPAQLALDGDAIVATGETEEASLGGAVGVARYTSDGALDDGFGNNGIAIQIHDPIGEPLPVVVQDDGTIGVAVNAEESFSPGAAAFGVDWDLLRWDDTGEALETETTSFPDTVNDTDVVDLELTTDDEFVVIGTAFEQGALDDAMGVAVHAADGEPESLAVTTYPGPPDTDVFVESIVRLGDGSFRVAGETDPDIDGIFPSRLALSRLDGGGTFDTSFGADGTGFATHNGYGFDSGEAVAVRADRRIVAGGDIFEPLGEGSNLTGFVLRHEESGPLDDIFAPDPVPGIEITRYVTGEEGSAVDMAVEGLALDDQDRPVLAGPEASFVPDVGVVNRLEPDGGTDPEFNEGFAQALALDEQLPTVFHDVVIDAQGRMVAVGEAGVTVCEASFCFTGTDIVVVRLLPDGSFDPDFGTDGVVQIGVGVNDDSSRTARGVDIDAAGQIVVTGMSQVCPGDCDGDPLQDHLFVARLLEDGTGDASFATDGDLGDGVLVGAQDHVGEDIVADGDELVVVGTAGVFNSAGGDLDAFVGRFTETGAGDTGFGTDGFTNPFDGTDATDSTALGVALDVFGDIVVTGGSFEQVMEGAGTEFEFVSLEPVDILLARLLGDGTPDPVFGTDGLVTTDLGLAAGEQARDVAIAPDGKIVVTGSVTDDRNTRVVVARYLPGSATLECVPEPADLGTVQVAEVTTLDVTCAAVDGRVEIVGLEIDPASANPDDFAVDAETCSGVTLAAGDSCQVTVSFSPSTTGPREASLLVDILTVEGDDEVAVGLQGRGELVGFPGILMAPDPVTFPERLVATTSPPRTVTVTNAGEVDLSITSVSVTGADAADFAVDDTTCTPGTLPAGSACTVEVTFTPRPGAGDDRAAALRVLDSATGSPNVVQLRGSVTPATLQVDPAEGPIETEVEATGAGYESGTPVAVSIAGTEVATVPGGAVTGGGFVVTFAVPEGTPGGDRVVLACQRCGTPIATAATATFTVTPRLFVDPEIGRPGFVTGVEGDGFPPGPVVLDWSEGIGTIEVTADAAGEVDTSMLVFHRDQVGQRDLGARLDDETEPAATAPFLVVPGRGVPNDFAIRR